MQSITSVISVTYHTGAVLDQMIASVLSSTVPVELILVNNGNPPEVEQKLRAMAATDPRLRFISGHGNVGFAKGCNLGAKIAEGKFLLFLNPDSILPQAAIERLYHEEAKLRPPFMLGACILGEDGQVQRGCRRALLTPKTAIIEALHLYKYFPKERLNLHEEPIPEKTTPVPAISGAFFFLSADDFASVSGFDEGYFLHVEDLDFCYRFRAHGGEIYFVPSVKVKHIGGTSDVPSIFLEMNKAKGFCRYFHENFGHSYPQIVLWAIDIGVWLRFGVKYAIAKSRAYLPQLKAKIEDKAKKK